MPYLLQNRQTQVKKNKKQMVKNKKWKQKGQDRMQRMHRKNQKKRAHFECHSFYRIDKQKEKGTGNKW